MPTELVHGFRRWFHCRSEGSTSNQSSLAGEGEADDGSPDLEVIEDQDLLGLRTIRVPKRKMSLPIESHKKVRTKPRRERKLSAGYHAGNNNE